MRLPTGETLPVAVDGSRLTEGDTATLGIRAEDFVTPDTADALLQGRLGVAERLGYETLAHIDVDGVEGTVTQRLDRLACLEPRQALTLGLSGEQCHLFDAEGRLSPPGGIPGIAR